MASAEPEGQLEIEGNWRAFNFCLYMNDVKDTPMNHSQDKRQQI